MPDTQGVSSSAIIREDPISSHTPPPTPAPLDHKTSYVWLLWVVGAVGICSYLVFNSYFYLSTFAQPVGHDYGTNGYYTIPYPIGNAIYFFRKTVGGELSFKGMQTVQVEGADASTFRSLNTLYGVDKHHVYFAHGKFLEIAVVPTITPEEFVVFAGYYGHDIQNIYYAETPLIGANPLDFRFAEDMQHQIIEDDYYGGGPRFLVSNGKLFFGGEEIAHAIRQGTFAMKEGASITCPDMRKGGGIPGDSVYFVWYECKATLSGVDEFVPIDTATFEVLEHARSSGKSQAYAKDKNHVYYFISDDGRDDLMVIGDANPETFSKDSRDNSSFFTDNRGFYYVSGCRVTNEFIGYRSYAFNQADPEGVPTLRTCLYESRKP